MALEEWPTVVQEWMAKFQAEMAEAFPPPPPGMKWEYKVDLGAEVSESNTRKVITEGWLVPIMDFGDD